jgi:hypothetical protein
MATVSVKQKITFIPGKGYDEKIVLLPGVNHIDGKHLKDDYLKHLVEKGVLTVHHEIEPEKEVIAKEPIEDIKKKDSLPEKVKNEGEEVNG